MTRGFQPLVPLSARWRWKVIAICLSTLLSGALRATPILTSLTGPIREEINHVERELESLPVFPINRSPWTLGYSSEQHKDPTLPLTIEVRFPESAVIDLVALMPSTVTDQRNQVQAWGFPVRFTIEKILPDGGSEIIVDYSDRDYPMPGIEPQFFECVNPLPTNGLRITVTEPASNSTWWHSKQIVSFSELYAFAGPRNLALNAEVQASSSNEFSFTWSAKNLTDGFSFFSPLFHDLDDPENNIGGYNLKTLHLEMDLGEVRRIDEFHLWPVVHSVQHNFPPATGLGFPLSIRLESSLSKEFTDSKIIYENTNLVYRPGEGPLMRRTEPTDGRFLRFTLENGFPDFIRWPPKHLPRIALSEVGVLSGGEIISRGIKVHAPELTKKDQNRIYSLTDGRSNEGQILPLREWLVKFQRRVQLEARLQTLSEDLEAAQLQEERRSRIALFMAIACILILLQLIWLIRVVVRRRAARMRDRIACDLHDEVGANVSSIAHTAELLAESIQQPNQTQNRLLGNLIESARHTYQETKHFIRFIEADNQSYDIAEQFVQTADRILGTISRTFLLENKRSFNSLNPRTKWNLLLFYKEALNNIIKHAEATNVEIKTSMQKNHYMLQVTDDGCGFPPGLHSCRRLEERAALLHGKLDIDSKPNEGTQITLYF